MAILLAARTACNGAQPNSESMRAAQGQSATRTGDCSSRTGHRRTTPAPAASPNGARRCTSLRRGARVVLPRRTSLRTRKRKGTRPAPATPPTEEHAKRLQGFSEASPLPEWIGVAASPGLVRASPERAVGMGTRPDVHKRPTNRSQRRCNAEPAPSLPGHPLTGEGLSSDNGC